LIYRDRKGGVVETKDLEAFADLLHAHKGSRTLVEIGAKVGFDTKTYHSPGYNLPMPEKLPKIAEAYGVSIEVLMEAFERVKAAKRAVKDARRSSPAKRKDMEFRCFSRRGHSSAMKFS